jgi:hypothetical protein
MFSRDFGVLFFISLDILYCVYADDNWAGSDLFFILMTFLHFNFKFDILLVTRFEVADPETVTVRRGFLAFLLV